MAFTHALSSNNYGPNKFIVATSAANGTHTTLAGAISDSTAGDTIIMRDSVTEDVTLKAGVNIYADGGSGNAYAVSITGNCTATAAGIFTIVGVKLNTNGASLLTVSGSAATQVILERCYLNIGGSKTGITFSSSSSSSTVVVTNCTGNYAGSGAILYNCTSAGQIEILQTEISNSSLSTAAATSSAGVTTWRRSRIDAQVQTTSTATLQIEFSDIWTNALNITALVNNGTGVSSVLKSRFDSGTATCVTCGSGASITLADVVLGTTNGTRTSGSGTITIIGSEQVATSYATGSGTAKPVSSTGVVTFAAGTGIATSGSGSTVTTAVTGAVPLTVTGNSGTATPSSNTFQIAGANGILATGSGAVITIAPPSNQCSFSAYLGSAVTNATGNGTAFTLGTTTALTKIFDLGTNLNTNGTFTAPVTGHYLLTMRALVQSCTISTVIQLQIVTTARTYTNKFSRAASSLDLDLASTFLCDMTANDTATFVVTTSGEAGKTNSVFGGAGSAVWTGVAGYLVS